MVKYKVSNHKERVKPPQLSEGSGGSGVEVKFAAFANWFTDHGVYMKQKALQAEGFPMPSKWMMITLTVDPLLFHDDPLDAYLYLKPKITRYMNFVADKLHEWGYFEEAAHCVNWWKFEFQANGWPHWHVFTNLLDRVTQDQLTILRKRWKYGRIEYKQCDEQGHYAFKYAFKAPLKKYDAHNLKDAVPEWFAKYYNVQKIVVKYLDDAGVKQSRTELKPESFDRVRFFQRSQNFLPNYSAWLVSKGEDPHSYKVFKPRKTEKPKSCHFPRPVEVVLDEKLKKVQVIARTKDGEYMKSTTIRLVKTFESFARFLIEGTMEGKVVSVKPNHYFLDRLPKEFAHLSDNHKLIKKCQQNKMTLARAQQIQKTAFALMNSAFRSAV